MNAPRTTPRPHRERGSISVEFALMLTFFFMPLLLGIIDFGQILHAQSVVARAARERRRIRWMSVPSAFHGTGQGSRACGQVPEGSS